MTIATQACGPTNKFDQGIARRQRIQDKGGPLNRIRRVPAQQFRTIESAALQRTRPDRHRPTPRLACIRIVGRQIRPLQRAEEAGT